MVTKIYAFVWLLLIAAGGLLHITGNINDLTMTVIGFMLATLTFMGLVAVLPWWVDKKYSWNYAKSDGRRDNVNQVTSASRIRRSGLMQQELQVS